MNGLFGAARRPIGATNRRGRRLFRAMSDTAPTRSSASAALVAHVADQMFPCVGAKSALAAGGLAVVEAGPLTCGRDDDSILDALESTAEAFWRGNGRRFHSLAVLFADPAPVDEPAFEAQMWARLQALADRDAARGAPVDPEVSEHPASPWFALSLGGHGYFVVGLHPAASRPARRFASPVLVFNLQAQFAALRREGRYDKMRAAIMARDTALAGAPNPMLADFGDTSAAAQFSGRPVGADWFCPFLPPRRSARAA
jgi:FPC/CPF motif-containing protein YcgG